MDLSNENIILKKNRGFEYLQFKKLNEYSNLISHAYSLGININFRTSRINKKLSEEEFFDAINNYNELCKCLNLDYKNIVKAEQKHTDNVKIVNFKEGSLEDNLKIAKQTDSLITNKKDIILSTTNADCILMIVFDPIKKVIANIHSGWRGTIKRISVKTIEKMKETYGCNPRDIICCICPSIRKCHFEVDEDVYKIFYNEFKDLKEIESIIEKNLNNKKWNIDTVLINKIILRDAGLLEENIIDSKLCSVCNKEYIHSFRVEKEGYGLETALISLI